MLELQYKISSILSKDLHILKSVFNIRVTGLLRLYFDGRFFYSCSNKKLVKHYYKHIKSAVIWLDEQLLYENNGFFVSWPCIPNHDTMKIYLQYNYWNGGTFVQFTKDYINLWWVAHDSADNKHEYSDHLHLIIKYFNYLNKRFSSEYDLKDMLYTYEEGIDFTNLDYLKRKKQKYDMLSKREKTCLALIKKGYTAKQTALELDISVNTVHTYIARLKEKMNVNYKSELILIK